MKQIESKQSYKIHRNPLDCNVGRIVKDWGGERKKNKEK